jgi:nucleoside-diphosphate-sugar epimerase
LSEVERLWADNSRAKDILNWVPAYTDRDGFIKGITKTVDWYSDSSNIKHYKSHLYNV